MTYTCVGPVRGLCGHKHKTVGAAVSCCAKDQAAIRRAYPGTFPAHAYSDRVVVRCDGMPLDDDEIALIAAAESED